MKKLLLFFTLLLSTTAHAQSWQWAKRGGATNNSRNYDPERVYDMTTDKWGNVYAISYTNMSQINIDGHSLPTGIGDENAVVASWDCNGNYRWSKFIGCFNGWNPLSIGVDTLGGVYVTGFFSSIHSQGYFRIGTDTTFGYTEKRVIIFKLDSSGAYKWARLPEADTATLRSTSIYFPDMEVEGDGTVHLLAQMWPGAYADGQLVIPPRTGAASSNLYIMKYDKNGRYTGVVKPQIDLLYDKGTAFLLSYDARRKKYYFDGYSTSAGIVSFNGNVNDIGYFVASYDAQGKMIWFRKNGAVAGRLTSKPAFDAQGNLFIMGATLPNDTFMGHVFLNPLSTRESFPIIASLDSSGGLRWVQSGQSILGGLVTNRMRYSNGVVGIAGIYRSTMRFGTYQVSNSVMSTGTDLYFARLDAATGTFLSLDSAKSPAGSGADDYIDAMAADSKGNFYLGGNLGDRLSFGPHTIANSGGKSDWLIAKFGAANCGCAAPPAAPTFTATATAPLGFTFSFALRSPTAGIDSVVWLFGDGGRQVVKSNFTAAVQHTYAAAGHLGACAVVYTACGNNQSCHWLGVATGVEALDPPADVSLTLAPNPASQTVQIGYQTTVAAQLEVWDVLGRKLTSQPLEAGTSSWNLDVSGFVPGVYQVVLRTEGRVSLHQTLAVQH